MARKVTMKMIADELNLATSAVSRALSGQKGVGEETRRRVIATARQLGYLAVPVLTRASQVVLLVEESTLYGRMFWGYVVNGLVTETPLHNAYLSIAITDADGPTFALPPLFEEVGRVNGVIAIRQTDLRAVQAVRKLGIPVVLLNYLRVCQGCDSVVIDDHGGTFQVAMELAGLGHREFGFIGNHIYPSHRRRYEGIVSAAIQAKITDRLPPYWRSPEDLPRGDLPTALLCCNDRAAVRTIDVLLRRGIRVPEDVSVVGFNDNAGEIAESPIPLTTLHVNREELGRQAVRTLFQRLNNLDCPPLQVAVSVTPVWRESTGKPRG